MRFCAVVIAIGKFFGILFGTIEAVRKIVKMLARTNKISLGTKIVEGCVGYKL